MGETGAQAKLRVEDLHKAFDGKVVLDGLSFSVRDGESLVIVGPSGTGKSVLLKHLIGLIQPDSGRVFVDGKDVWAISDRERNQLRKQFGMSFQEGALFDSMSVFENVAFPLRRSGRPPREIRQRVRECLDIVHLPDVEDKRPSELSGGMRRRVGFARAIAHEPDILLFDEPNTGLDPIMTDVIDEVILNMRERLKATIVTITHNMPSAEKIG
ncbi:MAG: ATP-binding cassette domain-containing protein, partial [Gemmatimonadota bacterium]|nr:ATP-binding cassette domain-containing protein [Gemmatimonadota bacterium]